MLWVLDFLDEILLHGIRLRHLIRFFVFCGISQAIWNGYRRGCVSRWHGEIYIFLFCDNHWTTSCSRCSNVHRSNNSSLNIPVYTILNLIFLIVWDRNRCISCVWDCIRFNQMNACASGQVMARKCGDLLKVVSLNVSLRYCSNIRAL